MQYRNNNARYTVGATAEGKTFLATKTILVIVIGLVAFAFSTAGGVLFGKLMNLVTHGKVNPLIGSAGVSAVPMAARVSQVEGRKYNPSNFLLMHAMVRMLQELSVLLLQPDIYFLLLVNNY